MKEFIQMRDLKARRKRDRKGRKRENDPCVEENREPKIKKVVLFIHFLSFEAEEALGGFFSSLSPFL